MIHRLLVANRIEIASRVFATCRRLGIETVAVHSEADAALPYVREADFSVPLSGNAPTDTYLRADLLVAAALASGADAVHPGYGFLSENADFARGVVEAGLVWIGPPAEAIDAMGSKIRAKRLMAAAGVPVLAAHSSPQEADLPLLVKASAGGGGRGMRVVRSLSSLAEEVAAAESEALSVFGDPTVFVEPYVEHGRHVEVQVVADHESVLILGDRDCSVQRRHQKVVEEAPAPALPPRLRAAMHEAARCAAQAIDYRGAGTVEFLVDVAREAFWFLEMNTRLQVEHPVTEAVWGVDLVELQLRVADGRGVGALSVEPVGHAVEVRLYAEDADHLPQSGRLSAFDFPDATTAFGPLATSGIRVDAGFEAGSEVSTHYDAMLAKVISWAPARPEAIRQLQAALRRARLHGVTTNREQLLAILADPRFAEGRMTTSLLASGIDPVPGVPLEAALRSATAALIADRESRRTIQRGVPAGWRNVAGGPHTEHFLHDGTPHAVGWRATPKGPLIGVVPTRTVADHPPDTTGTVGTTSSRWRVDFIEDGVATWHRVSFGTGLPGGREVYVDGPRGSVTLHEVPRFVDPATQHPRGSLLAPMPGTVTAVHVGAGDQVTAGKPLLVLEAMKMQHPVTAPIAGTLTAVPVHPGQQVAAGDLLAVVE